PPTSAPRTPGSNYVSEQRNCHPHRLLQAASTIPRGSQPRIGAKDQALILDVSPRSVCQTLRLSEMAVIDPLAFCSRAAYPTTSRSTRAASRCSMSLNICSSPISFSISCTEVPDTCCSIEPISLAASSLSFPRGGWGAVSPRDTTLRISPSSFEKISAASLASAPSRDRGKLMFNAPD